MTWSPTLDTRGAFLEWSGQTLYWDCIVKEGSSFKASVTRHPVEKGVDITDHIRPEPKTVSLQGYISQAPIKAGNVLLQQTQYSLQVSQPPSSLPFVGTTLTNSVPATTSLTFQALSVVQQGDLVQAVITTLQSLQEYATLVTVTAPNFSYENMIVESFEVSGDAQTGTGRLFDVSLVEIRTVQSLTTAAPQPASNAPQTAPKNPTGAQPPTPAPTGTKSLAAKLFDWAAPT